MGKSAAMCQAFDVIKKRGKKCVCYDVKYSFINKFYDPLRDLIYSPGDRKSFSWNFFNELAGSDFEVRAKIDIITKSLVPENERAIDKYWVTSPREVLYAIILYLHLGGRDNLTELKKMISQDIGVVYDALLSCPETMSKAAYINPKNDRTSHSTWTTLLSYLGFLDYLQEQRSDFRLSDWIENDSQENGQTIFLSDYGSARPFMPLSTLFIDLAAFYISKLPDTKGPDRTRVYFFIDEFGALNPMLSIVDLIKLYRSKGASVWVTSQDFSQIAEKYGMLQTTITDSCASQFYFSVGDETANMLERMIGAAEYEESDVHANIEGMGIKTDHTINRSFRTKPAVLAGEIKRMEKLNFIVKMNGRYFRGFINGKDLEKFADREIGFESI
jgi:type IV secretory pathway TraG/TraD family ATPase VirD4